MGNLRAYLQLPDIHAWSGFVQWEGGGKGLGPGVDEVVFLIHHVYSMTLMTTVLGQVLHARLHITL